VILPPDEGTIVRIRGELTLNWSISNTGNNFVNLIAGWLVRNPLAGSENRNPYNENDTDYIAIQPNSCMIPPSGTINYVIDGKGKRRYEKSGLLDLIFGVNYELDSRANDPVINAFFAGRILVEY